MMRLAFVKQKGCGVDLLWLMALVLATAGCSATHISDLSKLSRPAGGIRQDREGLGVNVTPLTDVAMIRQQFGTDLIAGGILPVFVEFKNESAKESFLVMPEKCRLMSGGAANAQTAKQPRSLKAGESTQVVGGVLLSGPLIVAGAIMATKALSANHQFAVNQLGVHTLSPGGAAAGYLYFKIPSPSSALEDCSLAVEVPNSSSGETVLFQFPLHIKIH